MKFQGHWRPLVPNHQSDGQTPHRLWYNSYLLCSYVHGAGLACILQLQ